ncbi:hypothetical protein TanjilG_01881 [Lupinus angustifolius]|uniref:Fe2OG dioxygenase domain-containing protein n=1 Tax=Lupinus angustifolius TaxID=3871 RepID=A0A394D9C0_LUPAN|nr:hypothetical protein TanjilG_01881 [Lupinus angustifolius]
MDSSQYLVSSHNHNQEAQSRFFDPSWLKKQPNVPMNFIWPKESLEDAHEEFQAPVLDLEGFLKGDNEATLHAAKLISKSCMSHGFFQTQSSMWGYSGAHANRFSSKLPWKETLSFPFHDNNLEAVVTNYFSSTLGEDFEQAGVAFQKYCEAMKGLGMKVIELLAISLGTEPHCDPTSVTILHQDDVGRLHVFADNKWQMVKPRPDALVVNIGDTFKALSNGRYKSCFHRAVVNQYKERRSLAFFLCPKEDKVLRPPEDIVLKDGTKQYPDFTWSNLLEFTQKYYRADEATMHNFTKWLLSSKPQTPSS